MINIKKASPLATLALAGALTGCGNDDTFVYEFNSPIANGYDIALDVKGLRREVRVGKIYTDENGNYDSFAGHPVILAESFDEDNAPERIQLFITPAEHPLRELANHDKLEEIGDYLERKESNKNLLKKTIPIVLSGALLISMQTNVEGRITSPNIDIEKGSYILLKSQISGERDYFIDNQYPGCHIKNYLEDKLSEEIIPFWVGTDYDFNGTTEIPNEGKIACGYFVSTTLRDLGFNIDRYQVGKMASENIMKFMSPDGEIHRYSNIDLEIFCKEIGSMENGMYIVGLDYHTGYLLKEEDNIEFIHASFISPFCVVSENARESDILKNSNYRSIMQLFDDEMIKRWSDNYKY